MTLISQSSKYRYPLKAVIRHLMNTLVREGMGLYHPPRSSERQDVSEVTFPSDLEERGLSTLHVELNAEAHHTSRVKSLFTGNMRFWKKNIQIQWKIDNVGTGAPTEHPFWICQSRASHPDTEKWHCFISFRLPSLRRFCEDLGCCKEGPTGALCIRSAVGLLEN